MHIKQHQSSGVAPLAIASAQCYKQNTCSMRMWQCETFKCAMCAGSVPFRRCNARKALTSALSARITRDLAWYSTWNTSLVFLAATGRCMVASRSEKVNRPASLLLRLCFKARKMVSAGLIIHGLLGMSPQSSTHACKVVCVDCTTTWRHMQASGMSARAPTSSKT